MKTAYFACGCFWGVEYYFSKFNGVTKTVVGFMGGKTDNPSYKQVCTGTTGHYETVEVSYDSSQINFEDLTKYFFEIHDFTQTNGQGPDIGEQYLSVIFTKDEDETKIANSLIEILKAKGYNVATKIKPVSTFWKAEDYHQQYFEHNHLKPSCHLHHKIF